MAVREHLSQHDRAERAPSITDQATVTGIEAMDHNRASEIRAAVVDLVVAYDREEWFDEVLDPPGADPTSGEVVIDWKRLGNLVDDAAATGSLREKITTHQERFERLRAYLRRDPKEPVDGRIDPNGIVVYTVGIGAMVRRLMDVVGLVGVPASHVHAESYG